ncbi:hypothetical protein GA0070624_5073 [Micromonospora rhizosphaerae]|uniref:Integral membrane protein n=1 Tax=Micromonospora rhizosphaerae TaxID=568872 RepID=A0A1C6SYT1_9ACTN|nr:hypothetical protein [Micromonospora rhizosphaerae]SCL34744.1 hypothetical protein GA0070624_5073 [Micromonospora rhizosphaerae]
MSDGPAGVRGPATPDDVVELRVHGVSAPGADQVLGRPFVQQVAGDRSAGFYRPRPDCPHVSGARGVTLEAYLWSDLPSGTAVRTLSLVFLLPFMLLNVAIWMRPGDPASDAMVRSLCRVLGLTLTALYVLAAVGVALDLVAWQCMSSSACLSGRSWLSWLGERPTGLRLAVLALVPAAAIGLIWWVSTRPGRMFNAFRPPESTLSGHPLSTVGQWDAEPLVGRLRSIHVAAAFATLDGSLLAARVAQGASAVTTVLAVGTGAVLATCVALLCAPPLIDQAPANQRLDGAARVLRTIAIGLTIVVPAHVLATPTRWHEGGGLPGYASTLTWLFVAHAGLLAALAAALLWRRGRHPGHPPLLGLGALAAAAAAASLAVAFSAELVHRVADYLDRTASTPEDLVPRPPGAYTWSIYGFFRALLITLVIAGLMAVISRRGRSRAAAAIVARDFPDPPAEAAPRLRQVREAIVRARFTERLIPLAVVYACLAGLGAATTALDLLGLYPGDVIERNARVPADLVNFGIGLGSYVVAATLLGLVVGGIFAYRTAGFRRHVGVLWDLATFWPRAAHPFAPPCYAERAVPELARRITYLVGSGNAVLIAGYSHGSVLVTATLLQLPPQVSGRVALLTYASPLRRLYARLFPAYIDDEMLHEVGGRVGWRWLNLWRDTDPIGGWIFSAHRPDAPLTVTGPAATVDRRLRDPSDVVAPPSDSVPPPIKGHGPREADEPFTEAARELVERLRKPMGPRPAHPPAGQ